MSKLKKTIFAALMLATTIVLSRFLSIKTPVLVISFSFIPIMLSAVVLGPFYATLVSGLADLIGALLFPFGSFFIGYTISAALSGFIYGVFLYRGKKQISNKAFIIRLILSSFLVILICNTLLNTLWIYITTKKALIAILPTRLLKQLILLPIQVITIYLIDFSLRKFLPNFYNNKDKIKYETLNTENINDKNEISQTLNNENSTENAIVINEFDTSKQLSEDTKKTDKENE